MPAAKTENCVIAQREYLEDRALADYFFVIWHGVRYGHTVFKNHRKHVQLDFW